MQFQELYTSAIALQPRDKAVLALGLLSSLNAETDEDTTALWVAENRNAVLHDTRSIGRRLQQRSLLPKCTQSLGNKSCV